MEITFEKAINVTILFYKFIFGKFKFLSDLNIKRFDIEILFSIQMPSLKKTILGGILLGGALTSILQQVSVQIQDSHKNCDHEGLAEIVDIMQNQNPMCSRWVDQKCVQCSSKTYFNQKGICIQIDPLCKTFDQKKKKCSECYPGYSLSQEKCIITSKEQENWALLNPLCSNWGNKKCIRCSSKSYFNSEGICVMSSPDCKTFNQKNGNCLSCYDGYQLQGGRCNKFNQDNWKLKNPFCSQWGSNGICNKCATRSYKNKQGICIQVDPNCNDFLDETGNCLSCFGGYSLKDGKCLEQKTNNQGTNPFCSKWEKSRCVKCSDRSFLNKNGICTVVSPQCRTYSEENGECTACFQGFQLKNGICSNEPQSSNSILNNPLCGQWSGNKCVRCSPRSYFQKNGICVEIDPFCDKFNQQKKICQKCYRGYRLRKDLKGCVLPGQFQISTVIQTKGYDDPYCSEWDGPTSCKKCAIRSYKGKDNRCIVYDVRCKNFNEKGVYCAQCFDGYIPAEQKCLILEKQSANFDLERCTSWKQGTCIECANGLQLNSTGLCSCK